MSSVPESPLAVPALPAESGLKARRGVSLTQQLVEFLTGQIRTGTLAPGGKLPTEAEIIAAHGVSRTVVREALSRLTAAGLTVTRHGVGTFVRASGGADFRIDPAQMATLVEVLALLELRISMEAEAAALAALRRSEDQLKSIDEALAGFADAVATGDGTVEHDYQFHLRIARATDNHYFSDLLAYLGTMVIPRTRLNTAELAQLDRREYLAGVHREHQTIFQAIERRDADAARAAMRTHLAMSRERLRRAHEAAVELAKKIPA